MPFGTLFGTPFGTVDGTLLGTLYGTFSARSSAHAVSPPSEHANRDLCANPNTSSDAIDSAGTAGSPTPATRS